MQKDPAFFPSKLDLRNAITMNAVRGFPKSVLRLLDNAHCGKFSFHCIFPGHLRMRECAPMGRSAKSPREDVQAKDRAFGFDEDQGTYSGP